MHFGNQFLTVSSPYVDTRFSIFTFRIVYQPRDHGHNDVFGGHEWQLGQDSAFDHLLVHDEAFKDVLASMIMFFFGTDAAAK